MCLGKNELGKTKFKFVSILEVEYSDLIPTGFDGGYNVIMKYNGRLFTGIAIERFASGSIETKIEYINGYLEGSQKLYYETGQLKEEYFLKDGFRDGIYKSYYETGELLDEIEYKLGNLISGQRFGTQGTVIKKYSPIDNYEGL